eukprot:CAMPEP_0182914686 /NCGR_PEP_ID=MMETSP0034_2-20130328/38697_1 /TAXON_ID=156128 /ORGANISM="Nephroselmis pyriformis, Strain CCMP717" /LENGTH=735 /DNA_ID=CAMNT_0025051469 /DNA_START=1791 /DNA_END=3995 /DNA_ORIENTATION=-
MDPPVQPEAAQADAGVDPSVGANDMPVLPQSMQNQLKSLNGCSQGITRLTGRFKVDKDKLAKCWPHHDIFFTGKNPTFKFGMSDKGEPMVDKYRAYGTKCFVWAPDLFWSEDCPIPTCPTCKKNVNVGTKGFAKPRRVAGTESRAFNTVLVSRIYRCKNCPGSNNKDKEISAHDEHVLGQLPDHIRMQFPAITTKKAAITTDVMDDLKREVTSSQGKSFRDYAKGMKEKLSLKHLYIHRLYAFHMLALLGGPVGTITSFFTAADASNPGASKTAGGKSFEPFPSFEQVGGYYPSGSYLASCFEVHMLKLKRWIHGRLCFVFGQGLTFDHTFKIMDKVKARGSKPFTAVASLMNSSSQIVGQWWCFSTSLHDVTPHLLKVNQRYIKFAAEVPLWLWLDMCCTHKDTWRLIFGIHIMIFLDTTHAIRRVLDTLTPHHRLTAAFAQDLSGALFYRDLEDYESLKSDLAGQGIDIDTKSSSWVNSKVRRYLYDRDKQVEKLRAVCNSHMSDVDNTGEFPRYLFTGKREVAVDGTITWVDHNWGTMLAFRALLDHVQRGCLEDPKLVTGDRVPMYIEKAKGGRYCRRGASKLEGYHRWLQKNLQGCNNRPTLAGLIVMLFNFRWNVARGIENNGDHDYHHFDLWHLHDINRCYRAVGLPEPYPQWHELSDAEVDHCNKDEKFGPWSEEDYLRREVTEWDLEVEFEEEKEDEEEDEEDGHVHEGEAVRESAPEGAPPADAA